VKRTAVAVGLLFLVGCVDDIETAYGSLGGRSVNGLAVLQSVIESELDADRVWSLDDDLGRYRTLIYCDGPDEALTMEHFQAIQDWLDGERGRRFVYLQCDGGMAEWLMERWLAELRRELATADEENRDRIEDAIDRLIARIALDPDPRLPGDDPGLPGWLPANVERLPQTGAARLRGWHTGPAPPFWRVGSRLVGDDLRPLLAADGRLIAGSFRAGRGRMTVFTTTLPFLDAAQVDPVCRGLLGDFVAHLREREGPVGWLRHMRYQSEPPPPNLLSLLFATPPFNYAVIHLLLLVLVWVWMRGFWLGRVEGHRDLHLEHFDRHLRALGGRLRAARAWNRCLEALARRWGAEETPRAGDESGAVALARGLARREQAARLDAQREANHEEVPHAGA